MGDHSRPRNPRYRLTVLKQEMIGLDPMILCLKLSTGQELPSGLLTPVRASSVMPEIFDKLRNSLSYAIRCADGRLLAGASDMWREGYVIQLQK